MTYIWGIYEIGTNDVHKRFSLKDFAGSLYFCNKT